MDSENVYMRFVELIVHSLCDKPELVKIVTKVDERGTLITVYVDKADAGRLIGKGGETVNAMRTLLHVLGMKLDIHFGLKINNHQEQKAVY